MKFVFCFLLAAVSLMAQPHNTIHQLIVAESGVVVDELESSKLVDLQFADQSEELEQELEPFIGMEMSHENLISIKAVIAAHFLKIKKYMTTVSVPEQKVTGGRVVFLVYPTTIEKLAISGNCWFSSNAIEKSLNLHEGDCVCEEDLLNSTAWINRNPFIYTDIALSKGEKNKTTDVEILARDRFPLRVYGGVDNTGTSVAGNQRFFAGVNFSLNLNAVLTYQLTSGLDFPEFMSHFGHMTVFLPWKHEWILFGGYATIHPTVTDFDSKGSQAQVSTRYVIPFKPLYTPFQHQLTWGADYKYTNSALFFVGFLSDGTAATVPVNQKSTDLFQFYLGYQFLRDWDRLKVMFRGETYFSPFTFLPHQNGADYNTIRPGAATRYIYAKAALDTNYDYYKGGEINFLFRAQVASNALLPSEEYGLGGFDTVRGYQELIYVADNAAIGNFEVRTPPISFSKNKKDKLAFLSFVDAAWGHNWKPSSSFPKDQWLAGVGAGMRYSIAPYLTTRLDYGFRLIDVDFANAQLGRVHFSALLAY